MKATRCGGKRAQIPPVHQLHDEEEALGALAHVVDGGDVLVVEVGGELRLGHEHARDGGVAREVRQHALYRHRLLEAFGAAGEAEEELRHASGGQGTYEPVAFVHGSPPGVIPRAG
jgi:hypothetical protein